MARHRAVTHQLQGVQAQRADAQTAACSGNKFVKAGHRAVACHQLDPALPGAADDAQVLRAFGIGGCGHGPGTVHQVQTPGQQRLQRIARAVELGQFDLNACRSKVAAQFRQQQMRDTARGHVPDAQQRPADGGFDLTGGCQQRGAHTAQGQHAAATGAHERAAAQIGLECGRRSGVRSGEQPLEKISHHTHPKTGRPIVLGRRAKYVRSAI